MANASATTGKRANAITADIFNTTLTLSFSTGDTIEIDASTLTPEIQMAAMLHGLKQKLVDAAAISRNPETGRSASVKDKYNAVREIADRLTAAQPSWNAIRTGGAAATGTLLVRALMQHTGRDKQYVEQFLENRTKDERKALELNPAIAAIIVELKRARTDGAVGNSDALLDMLGGAADESDDTEEEAA